MNVMLHKIMGLLWAKDIKEIDFCRAIGINKSAVTDWKRGKTTSYKRYLPEIAEYLQIDIEYLTQDNIILSEKDEIKLLEDYRLLNAQGQEFIRQTMFTAMNTYKKCNHVPDMEIADEINA